MNRLTSFLRMSVLNTCIGRAPLMYSLQATPRKYFRAISKNDKIYCRIFEYDALNDIIEKLGSLTNVDRCWNTLDCCTRAY